MKSNITPFKKNYKQTEKWSKSFEIDTKQLLRRLKTLSMNKKWNTQTILMICEKHNKISLFSKE